MSSTDQFVLYRGDEVQAIGTARELAAKLNKTPHAIRMMAVPTRVKRADADPDSQQMIAVRIPVAELNA